MTQISLLTENSLTIQQTRSFLANDFALYDRQGQLLGRVETKGSSAGRLLKGNRHLELLDAEGQLLLTILDPMDLGLDRYEFLLPDGSVLARLQRQVKLMGWRASLEVEGMTLELEGNFVDYDFTFTYQGRLAARVVRQWAGFVAGLRGKSRYGLELDPQAPVQVRLAILGALVGLDLMRAKADR